MKKILLKYFGFLNPGARDKAIENLLLKARKHGMENQYENALNAANNALYIQPKCEEALSLSGTALSMMGKWDRAIPYFSKAIELNPSNLIFLFGRSNAYMQLYEWQLALQDVNSALELDPTYINAICSKGIIFLNTRNRKGAMDQYDLIVSYEAHSQSAKIMSDAIMQSHESYQEEEGPFWVLNRKYVAGYWFRNGRANILWTSLADEALRMSKGTALKLWLEYLSNPQRVVPSGTCSNWQPVDPSEAGDLN